MNLSILFNFDNKSHVSFFPVISVAYKRSKHCPSIVFRSKSHHASYIPIPSYIETNTIYKDIFPSAITYNFNFIATLIC